MSSDGPKDRYVIEAEYSSETIYSGPYTKDHAMAIIVYGERDDRPMGDCSLVMLHLALPLRIAEN